MPGLCEVCSKEASKYKCPTCGVSSCSLGCTKSHKINCTPKQGPETAQRPAEGEQQQQQQLEKPQAHSEEQEKSTKLGGFSSSEEAQKLFAQYPGLRAKLREIYRTTQEEEWNSTSVASHNRYNNYKHHNNNRPPPTWTAERGFNRGLGKVRKWREGCEGGEFTDSDAEGFMKFIALVAPENEGS